MNRLATLSTLNSIDEITSHIQAGLSEGSLVTTETPLKHYHTDELYGRRIVVPAGCFFTTRVHKTDHISIALRGRITLLNAEGESKEVKAPDMFVTPAGTHRVVYVHEEVEFATIHACTEQDNDKVIDELSFFTMDEYQQDAINKLGIQL